MNNNFQNLENQKIPYSEEAEAGVLGAVIVDSNMYLRVAAFLKATDFFLLRHKYIWEAIERVAGRDEPLDYLTVTEDLKNHDKLSEIGGAAYVTQLINNTPTSNHAEIYGRLAQRAAIRRRLMEMADEIKLLALDEDLSVEQVLDKSNQLMLKINMGNAGDRQKTMREVISNVYDNVEARMKKEGIVGVPSGYPKLDELLGGFWKSDLTILAGRPGMGKTGLMMSVAINAARLGKRVGIFSMEMISEQLGERVMSGETQINLKAMRDGNLSQTEWARFTESTGRMSELPIWFDDRSSLRPEAIRTQLAIWQIENGIDLVLIDHLQEFGEDAKLRNAYELRSHDAKAMKDMARDLSVPVICLCQLSRGLENRENKRPMLSDLRDSGVIEEKADNVLFLYRDDVYNEASEFPNQADVIVSKHRNGPLGAVALYFDRTTTRFVNARQANISLKGLQAQRPPGGINVRKD